jgi:N-acetylmuramoyl-L-alanine amidase
MNIYISPSTQDHNVGVGNFGTEEMRMNQLADLVVSLLEFNGFTVYRNRPEMTLAQVCSDSNKKIGRNGLHVALHTNAGGSKGTEIWYFTGSSTGFKLAKDIYDEVATLTPSPDRGIKPSKELRELNSTQSTAIILESVFHDNLDDVNYILTHMEKVAVGIVKGICKYVGQAFHDKVKPPSSENVVNNDVFYRVITGSFSDKNNAINRANELLRAGFKSFIETYKK